MKILVTGGAGFIGSHVTELLCNQNHDVTVFDDLSKGYREFIDKRAKFIHASLENRDAIEKALQGIDAVVHLAAESIIKYSIDNPHETFRRNIMYLVNLLEAMRKNNVKYLVFSSSAAVYGEIKDTKPVKEDNKKEPMQPYGASKLSAEVILSSYYHCFNINSVSLRYFNVYGPRDCQLPVTRAVPNWFKAVIKEQPVGLNWAGKQIRDYIFVKDVAQAHLEVLGKEGYRQYNIGSGTGNSMLEILNAVFDACNKKTEILDLGERPGDPNYLVADTSKILNEIGWKPRFSLKEGMRLTYDFYKDSKNLPS
ncbi:MAG: GDP-mannose 4,6-dehydratase [Candidatus Nanoarchaeia archaeon]|nr:GDP-mannose 4,6-dehydratase [Candidatus Nanoarchaeia archaeon]